MLLPKLKKYIILCHNYSSPCVDIDEVQLVKDKQVFKNVFKQIEHAGSETVLRYDCSKCDEALLDLNKYGIQIAGDVVIHIKSDNVHILDISFNTSFIESNFLQFEKTAIDASKRDFNCLLFHRDFRVELFFHRVRNKLV